MQHLTGAAALAGVVGWPVAHSRSPRLHGHWIARHNIDGAYVPLAVAPENLATALDGLRACGFRGCNLTVPHKEAALALCDELHPSAARAGAVNTIVFGPRTGARMMGMNTDGAGFLASLMAAHGPTHGPALLLGAGGAARAIAAALLDAGQAVTVTNRAPARAAALADALPGLRTILWPHAGAALADHALLVNTTSLGMQGQPPLELGLHAAAPTLIVADIVYAPLVTPLLAAAAARGLRTLGGIGMLLHQAVPGFAAWYGVTPTVDEALERAVLG